MRPCCPSLSHHKSAGDRREPHAVLWSTKTGLVPSDGEPFGQGVSDEGAVAQAIEAARAAGPKVPFPVFKDGRYRLARTASGFVQG